MNVIQIINTAHRAYNALFIFTLLGVLWNIAIPILYFVGLWWKLKFPNDLSFAC